MNNSIAIEHLLLRLRPLNRALRSAVAFQGEAAARLFHPDVTSLCVTEEQVRTLLSDIDQLSTGPGQTREGTLTAEEAFAEVELRKLSQASQNQLPLDRLTTALGLSEFEQEAVLLCSAAELDRSYERIYAFILDDLNRRYPCVELLCSLTAENLAERCARRQTLSRFGKLRRYRVLQPHLEPATELRQELRLAPGLFAFLIGAGGDVISSFCDREEVALPESWDRAHLPAGLDPSIIKRSGQSIRGGRIEVLGIWGPRNSEQKEAAKAVALAAGLPLRRWLIPETARLSLWEQQLEESILATSALGAILWVDTDVLSGSGSENLRAASNLLASHLSGLRVPVILTGAYPWRPTELLAARSYAQLEISTPGYNARQTMWERAHPEVSKAQRDDLAARFRMNSEELRAAAWMAGTQAALVGNGRAVPITEHLEQACDAITRKQSYRFATVIKPRRGRNDLILPAGLHRQILEIAQFHRAWPRASEAWGFGRMVTGAGGIKVLFTGPSGTGKTLAAEVIAAELRMVLLKIDLSRVVSKWVGETERNLEQAFSEAEDSNALLFFDEADALFGKRGDVRHGVDRYANLEVSYLLQRLETYFGLVILASNLRDNIDAAFTRRFQIVLNFPRPEVAERRRIWELAFPRAAPLERDIDFDLLARLDMTGASIVNAAQTAALLAIKAVDKPRLEGARPTAAITAAHVIQAIARQFNREARLLTASELGPYEALLQEEI